MNNLIEKLNEYIGDNEDFDVWDFEELLIDWQYELCTVEDEYICDSGRWSNSMCKVISVNKDMFIELTWEEGATECQDDTPSCLAFTEVYPYKVTVTKYSPNPCKGIK